MIASPGDRDGRMEAMLENLGARMERIENKIDILLDWRGNVEARLATGTEKFRQMETRDRQAGWIGSIVGVIAATVSAIFVELRR